MTIPASAARRAFVCASVAWALTLPFASLAAARPAPAWPSYLFALSVYAVGSLICHQLPERSFHLWSAQMPVCARCTGIYVGGAVAAIVASVRRFNASARPLRLTSDRLYVLLGASVPTVLTLAYEWTSGHTPANWVRAVAGLPLGAAVSLAIVGALDDSRSAGLSAFGALRRDSPEREARRR